MGLLTRYFESRSLYSTLSSPEPWLVEALGGRPTAAGIQVTPENSLAVSAVYACVRVLSEDLAKLPLHLYRRLPGGGKERAVDHPLYNLLHKQPNPVTTSFAFREAAQASILLHGNAYAYIDWDGAGNVRGLWLLNPDRVAIFGKRDGRGRLEVVYSYMAEQGGTYFIQPRDMLHIPGMSFDGISGISVIRHARENIGLAAATQEFGARYFSNDAMPGVIVYSSRKLTDEEKEAVRKDFQKKYQGVERKFELAILEPGWDFKTINIPLDDAQFIESRKFQIEEIARMFRVPPHKIGHLERATYSNIEHQSIEYVMDSLGSWCVRWEQAMWSKLLTEADKRHHFPEFNLDALIRGDTDSRYNAYSRAILSGFLTPNEVRELENRNPLPGGDTVWMPVNMMPADQLSPRESSNAPAEHEEAASSRHAESRRAKKLPVLRQRLIRAYRPALKDALARIARREVNDVRRAAKKYMDSRSADMLSEWIGQYCREDVPEAWKLNMAPVLRSYAEAVFGAAAEEIGVEPKMTPELEKAIQDYMDGQARRHAATTRKAIQSKVREAVESGDDVTDALEDYLEEYEAAWPEKASVDQGSRFGNYAARAFFLASGFAVIRWVAAGEDPCPFCLEMDGKTVGRLGNFLPAGGRLGAGEDVMEVESDIGHPPLHEGCECIIVAG